MAAADPGAEPAPLGSAALLPFAAALAAGVLDLPAAHGAVGAHPRQALLPGARRASRSAASRGSRGGRSRPLKPKRAFFELPAFYVGNHTAFLTDGETLPWPSHTESPRLRARAGLRAATVAMPRRGGQAAIGGFFLVNDWSARDVQADEYRHGMFGPVVKAKTFNNSIGPWSSPPTSCCAPVRFAARARQRRALERDLDRRRRALARGARRPCRPRASGSRAGDVFATGTLPQGCGMELDRWMQPGDVVELELEGIGTLTNRRAA